MTRDQFLRLPEGQRKAIQQALKDQGLYVGATDGKWGAGTETALKAQAQRETEGRAAQQQSEERRRADELKAKELEIKARETEGRAAASDAETEALKAETARKQRYDEHASSGWGMAAQSAANLVAPAAGTAGGMLLGKGVNAAMDKAQESRNRVLRGVAADRVAGLTTREGAREAARLSGAVPLSNPMLRTTSRMLPHLGLGALSIGKGAQVLAGSNPNGEFFPSMADRAAGLGYVGVGAGLAKQGLRYASAPGVAPDAQALAIINSSQLRRGGINPAPAGDPGGPPQALPAPDEPPMNAAPAPGSKAHMREQAKGLGIKATANMTKAELAKALAEAMAEHGGKRTVAKRPKLPGGGGTAAALGAGLGYALTPDYAEAADGSGFGGRREALENAAAIGGIAYGADRAARMIPSLARALAGAGAGTTPAMLDDVTSPTEGEMATAANWGARNLPAWARSQPMQDAYDMAQVPERAPRAPGPEEAYYDDPAPLADGAAPDELVTRQLTGKLSQEQMRQIANALASGEVAGRAPPVAANADVATRSYAQRLMSALGL
jgi:hypothetical protein